MPWIDGAASVIIGLLLATVAVWLAQESRGLLVGEGAELEMIQAIEGLVRSDKDVVEVGPVLSLYNGPDDLLLNLEVEFRPGISTDEVHRAIHRIEDLITEPYPEIKRVFIEISSLTPGVEPK
jgi:divalent metal cation (Fe/Co/Zn/Cd) transporter